MSPLKRLLILALASVLLVASAADAGCGPFGRGFRPFAGRAAFRVRATACATPTAVRYTYRESGVVYAVPATAACTGTTCPAPRAVAPVYAVPQAPSKVTPEAVVPVAPVPHHRPHHQAAPMPVPQSAIQADGPGDFLALLNAARAQAGRPALAWDATLAAYAATNAATHMPGSSGGAAQCWAGCRSYSQAFHQWRGSAAHWSILMNATTSIGVSPCPTGMTANAR